MVAAWPPCKVQRGTLCRQGAAQADREQGGRLSVSVDGGGLYGKQNVVWVHVVHMIGMQKGADGERCHLLVLPPPAGAGQGIKYLQPKPLFLLV